MVDTFLFLHRLIADTLPKHQQWQQLQNSSPEVRTLVKECFAALEDGQALKAALREQLRLEFRVIVCFSIFLFSVCV